MREFDEIIVEFDRFEGAIEEALKRRDSELFTKLIAKRSSFIQILSRMDSEDAIPRSLLEKLADQNRKWLNSAQTLLHDTKHKINKLNAMKHTSRELATAYTARPATRSSLVSSKM